MANRSILPDGMTPKTVTMDPIPEEITEGEIVHFRGFFRGPQIERISILLHPTCDVENSVIKVKTTVTKVFGDSQRFEAQLQAPRGNFAIIVFPILEGERNLVTITVHHIKVISACASRVKQMCRRVFPGHDITMSTSIAEPLLYEKFKEIPPHTFNTLKGIYDDVLLTEKNYIEVVQRISLTADDWVWQVMLDLLNELLLQHGHCYLALQPSNTQRLLKFLPHRMWNQGIKPFCDRLGSYYPIPYRILNKFVDMVRRVLWVLGSKAPEFELMWTFMMGELELVKLNSSASLINADRRELQH